MKALRFVLLAIGCATIAVLFLRSSHPQWTMPALRTLAPARTASEAPPLSPQDARTEVRSRLADAPTYTPFFDRLRESFPGDFLSLLDQESATLAQTRRLPNPDRMMTDAMRRLRQSRGVLAAQAQQGPLDNMFAAQAATLDLLGMQSATLCVDFLYGGSSPEFMVFAAKNRAAVERLAVANLEAIVDGKTHRVERPAPDPADFDALAESLKGQGFSDDEVGAVLDGKTFDPPLPENRLCDAGRAYLRAVANLPDDVRARIYALSATLLARS